MAIDVGAVLRQGAEDVASTRGVVVYVFFAVFSLVSLPIHQTLNERTTAWLSDVAGLSPEEVAIPPTPLALDVSPVVVAGALVVIFLVAEVLRLAAIRSFASEASAVIPTTEVGEGFLGTYAVLLAASVLVQVLVYGGLVVFVVPGLVMAVLTLFVRQAVVIDGEGILDSLRASISIVVDHTLQVLLLLVALFGLGLVAGAPTLALDPESVATPVVNTLVGTVLTVYGIAVLTRAYQHAGDGNPATDALGPEDIDEGQV